MGAPALPGVVSCVAKPSTEPDPTRPGPDREAR
jgi:hypothetical protein